MRILLVEDDLDLGQAVVDHLRAAGHATAWCRLLCQVQAAPASDAALLDLHLPDGDGLALLRAWRSSGDLRPVIVLTARDQVSDRIRGLQAGADDYLVKPFDLDELLARLDALARRTHQGVPVSTHGVAIDTAAHEVRRGGCRIDLTAMEWAVLACLARRPGRVYARGEIEEQLALAGLGDADSNSLEVIVSRLRRKLGAALISTHRGMGYRLDV